MKCSKNLKATQDFNQSSKTHIINKPISFEHIQVPRAKEIDQLSGNVIGRLSVKPWCYWLWRLGMSSVPFNASTARLLFCYANTWLHRCLVTQQEDANLDYAKAALFVWAVKFQAISSAQCESKNIVRFDHRDGSARSNFLTDSGHLTYDYLIKQPYFVKCYFNRFVSISDTEKWTTNVAQRKEDKKNVKRDFEYHVTLLRQWCHKTCFSKRRIVANLNRTNFHPQNVT